MQTIDLTKIDSVYSMAPAGTVTDRYAFIPTTRVVEQFEKKGWLPVRASQVNTRIEERKGFQRHLIRFQHKNSEPVLQGLHPEIAVSNAHDGSACFRIMAGLFRMVCLNGLIVGQSQFGSIKIRHQGYKDEDVRLAIDQIMDHLPKVTKRIGEFQEIELAEEERLAFAESAIIMRHGENDIEDRFIVKNLIRPQRPEDADPTLWNTFNTVQENMIKGGYYLRNKRRKWVANKSRKVKSVDADIRINRGLWALTEKMAEIKKK